MSRFGASDLQTSPSLRPTSPTIDRTDFDYLDEDEDEDMMDESDQDYEQDDVYDDEDDEIDEDESEGEAESSPVQPQLLQVGSDVRVQKEKEDQAQQNQMDLRKQIILIQQDSKIPPQEKAKRIQELMTSKWSSRDKGKSTRASLASNKLEDKRQDFNLIVPADRQMTFHDKSSNTIGCKHYQRAAKLQAHCCGKWYTCRFCHDEVSDHNIIRNLITTMMCMHCSTVQPAGQDCINVECQKRVAKYYCKECKLWDDDPRKNIYHCYDCGICRIGKGLGQDYFHCKKCNVCMAISLKGRHKCIERNLESDCPICGEYMFTSTTTVIFMPCGHCIHYKCHQEYIQTSYQCPTCFKSLANMTEYFKRIDAMLAQHQMPPEYNKTQTFIYCNDCEKKCYAKFHFLYHKCIHCKGYNTKVLQTMEVTDGSTVETNNASLLALAPVEESKVEAKEPSGCCGSGSHATLGGSHPQLSHQHSHHSILSHRSSSASLHSVTLGSTAPVFSTSSSSLSNGQAPVQPSFGSLPQAFSLVGPQTHIVPTQILHHNPFPTTNTTNIMPAAINMPFQHQNHPHTSILSQASMIPPQGRYVVPNRTLPTPNSQAPTQQQTDGHHHHYHGSSSHHNHYSQQ
ncbi:zf-CHY-domain-containing protein [Rhizoclosmatium globosum]|uniref:Zf-CHY-domain-containing protein n=1 Tax=Rhizoclosmatium globosum TaxID=329046 RepID=A0A1Y2CHN1_9FUNG|nr:zf-CHY-domain-containing protein [Rhizoclosmatium globosum]|eukprot:ORY46446.1 zf-CHY-domain-containing protein [Rhizoclosmatium globosum]